MQSSQTGIVVGAIVALLIGGLIWYSNSTPESALAENDSSTTTNSISDSTTVGSQEGEDVDMDMADDMKNIVETAQAAGSFNTLIEAAVAADLAEALSTQEVTVFAPTDEAFANLPEGTLESLLADPHQLAEVLKYHVVAGKVMAADVVTLTSAETLQGSTVDIKVDGTSVMVDGANIVQTDIEATNGVIHVIDAVITP